MSPSLPFGILRGRRLSAILALASLAPCVAHGPRAASAAEPPRIAVVPKGATHEFWKSVHAGAAKAGRELGVAIDWKGPQREDDRELQVQVVEDFVTRKASGIVLAPLDDRALVRPVREARKKGIPVVIIDSALQGNEHVAYVATDNYKGGRLGGERLGEVLGGKGNVILMRYQQGSASTDQREKGFLDVMKEKFPGIRIVSDNQYAGATADTAFPVAQNLLVRFKDVDGIFCPNESSTFGMLRALQEAGRAGKVKFVGFDSSEKLVQGLRDGQIHGLVQQNPFRMGELGVRTMVAHLRGEKIEPVVDTGVLVVTPDNLEDPDVKALLNPPLDEYLAR